MPLAISSQRVYIWYHADPHDQWKRVTGLDSFLNGLGLSLGAKLVSTNDRPSIFFSSTQFFYKRGRKKNCAAFCTIRLDVLRGMSVIFRSEKRRPDLPVFNIKQILAKKSDPTLKPRHLKEIKNLTHFYAQRSKCPRRF